MNAGIKEYSDRAHVHREMVKNRMHLVCRPCLRL